MKKLLVIVGMFLAAAFSAGVMTVTAAPASAACSPSFTSIPCTIADNVAKAPAQLVGRECPNGATTCGLVAAPTQLAAGLASAPLNLAGVGCAQPTGGNPSGNQSSCGLVGAPGQLLGVGCPPDGDGNSTEPCGLTGQPGQFLGAGGGLEQIVTAPATIAGALANAPGQFGRAILNGGKDPETP